MPKQPYDNFKLAIYCPAPDIATIGEEALTRDLAFFEKHMKVSKVYLENHRGEISLTRERLSELKTFFESRGIETAGGITPTLPDSYAPGYPRLFGSICYADPESRAKFQEQVEIAASVFDEIIFDDFFFTNSASDRDIEAKGDRTWAEYRLELMTDVSENLIRRPAKAVNPNVKLVIKYPNWIESYQATGYNTELQPDIFDGIYTGTETRNPGNSQQRIPRYASYSLLRWMEHLKPGANGGGWFDNLDCTFIDYYLHQANLTVFGKARELTLFCYGLLKDSVHVPALGFQLEKLDAIAAELGTPRGLREYNPHHASGEDHLGNYLGNMGIPLEPSPYFPAYGEEEQVLVTAASAHDKDIVSKIQSFVRQGGRVVMTSGFVEAMQGKGAEHLTTLRPNGKKMTIGRYGTHTDSCTFRDFADGEPISFPVFDYATNGTWQRIVGFNGDNNIPILMYDHFGKGTLFTLVVPDNFADLAKLPEAVLNEIRLVLAGHMPVRLEGKSSASLFVYDNDTFVVQSYRTDPGHWRVAIPQGATLQPLGKARNASLYRTDHATKQDLLEFKLMPGAYAAYRIVR
ncbi:permease [Cohnella yongneupensis]|uniref:Permease n=1 Tax=Cohnella yongneupensis TaxID=425006 RepID=A0ABW0QXA9_9BACL